MSSRPLHGWYRGPLTSSASPQRAESTAWGVDRWLSGLRARFQIHLNFFTRWRLGRIADRVVEASATLMELSDTDVADRVAALRAALGTQGFKGRLVEEAFALIREVSRRTLGKPHYRVQLMGGLALLHGNLAEMATGEGKTLTALLPVVSVALAGIPVHVVTVNEYLARRDAGILKPVFEVFGLSTGIVTHLESDEARRAAYGCDIVYCVNKDLVFDFLRDGLDAGRPGGRDNDGRQRQRGLYYALIDEADSVLIDEARTPLVIAKEREDVRTRIDAVRALTLSMRLAPEGHYLKDSTARSVRLTDKGRKALAALTVDDRSIWAIAKVREERVEQALTARNFFRRGENYVVRDDKVQIVDEFTGRILPDRTWERGLHQMIETIEQCEPSKPRETIARQTYPRFFARYLRIAGMTGTATEVVGELASEYGLRVVRIPTHRPSLRKFVGARTFRSSEARWQAVALAAACMAATGRAVLIGTRSVAASETISMELAKVGGDVVVLNALQDEHEAEIIGLAGSPGRITIATNMAGRGTDILLDARVKESGGLHVILTEYHESARVDRQLFGRAARQGDPGSCEACVSLDDELFITHAPIEVRLLKRLYRGHRPIGPRATACLRLVAQMRAERRNAAVRKSSIHRDRRRGRALSFAGASE